MPYLSEVLYIDVSFSVEKRHSFLAGLEVVNLMDRTRSSIIGHFTRSLSIQMQYIISLMELYKYF